MHAFDYLAVLTAPPIRRRREPCRPFVRTPLTPERTMPAPDPSPQRKVSWQTLAAIGFIAGVITVILIAFVR